MTNPPTSEEFTKLAQRVRDMDVGIVSASKAFGEYIHSHLGPLAVVLDDYAHRASPDGGTAPIDTTPPVIQLISATATQTTARISFATNEEAECKIEINSKVYNTFLGTQHEVSVDGLVDETVYSFTITAFDMAGNPATLNGSVTTLPAMSHTPTLSSISKDGVTLLFDKAYPTSEYANGDIKIQGPVKLIGVTPASVTINGITKNGAMVNPLPSYWPKQGYDSRILNDYPTHNSWDATKNIAAGISPTNPLFLQPGTSLVCTVSLDAIEGRTVLKSAVVFTIVDALGSNDEFRPSYAAPWDKKVHALVKRPINYSLLKRLVPTPSAPTIEQALRSVQRVRLDHGQDWSGERLHPRDNMKAYDRDNAAQIGDVALVLNLDYPDSEKEPLVIALAQAGIDFYGIAANGGEKAWPGRGGVGQGRLWPILFAGIMMDLPALRNIRSLTINGQPIWFSETNQTFYVPQSYVGTRGYTQVHVGMAEWGVAHAVKPLEDDAAWGASYRQCCTATAWYGSVLSMLMMPGAKQLVNHNALFDYQDRYWTEQQKAVAAGTYSATDYRVGWSKFQIEMWAKYRSQF